MQTSSTSSPLKPNKPRTPPRQNEPQTPPRQDEPQTPPRQDEPRTPPRQDEPRTPPRQDEPQTPLRQNEPRTPPRQNELRTPRIHALSFNTKEQLLEYIFSPENIEQINESRYNNRAYLREFNATPLSKRRFIRINDQIDRTYPYLRYSIDELKKLLTNDSYLSFFNEQDQLPPLLLSVRESTNPLSTASCSRLTQNERSMPNLTQVPLTIPNTHNTHILPRSMIVTQQFPAFSCRLFQAEEKVQQTQSTERLPLSLSLTQEPQPLSLEQPKLPLRSQEQNESAPSNWFLEPITQLNPHTLPKNIAQPRLSRRLFHIEERLPETQSTKLLPLSLSPNQKPQETLEQMESSFTAPAQNQLPIKRKLSQSLSLLSSYGLESTDKTTTLLPFENGKIISFRFVMNSPLSEETLFAMGHSSDSMSHGQLAVKNESFSASCAAAGVICFEKHDDKWFIKSLSNKTGHFKCGPESLLKPISMLLRDFKRYLAEEITLILAPQRNSVAEESFTLSVSSLKSIYNKKMKKTSPNRDFMEDSVLTTPQNAPGETSIANNPHSLFKRQKLNTRLSSPQDNELVQASQETELPRH